MPQLVLSLLVLGLAAGCRPSSTPPASAPSSAASSRNGGLVLPDGFEATVFHPGVGRARHMAVTPDGIVYIKLRGPARGQTPEPFKGLVALRATGGDGRAGVWQFDARKVGQTEKDGKRYATGIRSLVAMTWNPFVKDLYALQHGRDDLYRSWPQ